MENKIKDYKLSNQLEVNHREVIEGIDGVKMYKNLTKEIALKVEEECMNEFLDSEDKVAIFCDTKALDNDATKYCAVIACNGTQMEKTTEYMLKNDFCQVYNLDGSKFDYNQVLKFYDKNDKLKCLYYTDSGQFHNAESKAYMILNANPNLSYATADLKGDVAAITRIGEDDKKAEINKKIASAKAINKINNSQTNQNKTKSKTKEKKKTKSNDYGMSI